jgi:hypothetical protein
MPFNLMVARYRAVPLDSHTVIERGSVSRYVSRAIEGSFADETAIVCVCVDELFAPFASGVDATLTAAVTVTLLPTWPVTQAYNEILIVLAAGTGGSEIPVSRALAVSPSGHEPLVQIATCFVNPGLGGTLSAAPVAVAGPWFVTVTSYLAVPFRGQDVPAPAVGSRLTIVSISAASVGEIAAALGPVDDTVAVEIGVCGAGTVATVPPKVPRAPSGLPRPPAGVFALL